MAFTVDILTIQEAATDEAVESRARAIESIQTAAAENPIILDFDKTLFLRNSTAEYLNSISPRPLGAAYLLAINAFQPWKWFNRWIEEEASKDWLIVVVATLLFPWTLLIWRARAKQAASAHWNLSLTGAIAQNPAAKVFVASNGFSWIINPLLKHLPDEVKTRIEQQSIACRFWQGLSDARKSKLQRIARVLDKETIARATLVTPKSADSESAPSVKTFCLARWPEAVDVPPMLDVYVPLVYSERVKNPGKSHIMKRVVAGHWAFLVLAFSFLSPHFLLNAAGLALLALSYWCVYEIGYWHNDIIGQEYENRPMLSDTFELYKDKLRLDTGAPWGWAVGLTIPAMVLIEASKIEQPVLAAIETAGNHWQTLALNSTIWICFLLAVHATFWIYNQFNEETRIWIYPFLQTQKLFGFTMIMSTNAIGAVLLLSLAVSRWLHYTIYRCGGDRDRFPLNTCCLVLFVLGFFATTLSSLEPTVLLTWQAGVAFVYCLVRGVRGFHREPNSISLVSQHSVSPVEPSVSDSSHQTTTRIALSAFKPMSRD